MELPFAVEDDSNFENINIATGGTTLPTTSPHAYRNVNLQSNPAANQNLSTSPSATSGTMNMTQLQQQQSRQQLHRVALYDNVHPLFYTPKPEHKSNRHDPPIPAATSYLRVPSNTQKRMVQQQNNIEEDFVTIDADDGFSLNGQNQSQSYHYPPSSRTATSMDSKHHLSVSKTSSRYGNQMDILSLLLNSVTSPVHQRQNEIIEGMNRNSLEITCKSNSNEKEGTCNENITELCEEAADAASTAAKLTREGKIAEAAAQHVHASKFYRDAAIFLRREYKDDLSFLAYSLLVLSNTQARSAESLVKNGGVTAISTVRIGVGLQKKNIGNCAQVGGVSQSGKSTGISGSGGRKEVQGTAGKEDRLRAKIRASMNTAEADMTDSTFLGRATSNSPGVGTSNARHGEQITPNAAINDKNIYRGNSVSTSAQEAKYNVNPVDDMMDLEQELKHMDATLNMGVNLSASTLSIATKKSSVGEGSFCVVPNTGTGAVDVSSSYMSSSIMWTSGIGGRPHGPAHSQGGRARANRVQPISGSMMGIHKSTSVGGHQQLHQHQNHYYPSNHNQVAPKHHPGLESSWWGQASVLASSTASLSNSMVGIRSSPSNPKELTALMVKLKTLGDENASLWREVEESKKNRMEAKAARESMRQFKAAYSQKYERLKVALNKFRSEYPDQRLDGELKDVQNVVSKSNYQRKQEESAEIHKRDKMIQKLTADLKAEKAESKKKDDALRKYENFYKEVKARSEQKKRQKEAELKRNGGA